MGTKSKRTDTKNNFNHSYGEKVNVLVASEPIPF